MIEMASVKTANAARGTIHGASSHNIVRFTVRALPLPSPILDFILENLVVLKKLQHDRKAGESQEAQDKADVEEDDGVDIHGDIVRKPSVSPDQFWGALTKVCDEVGGEWKGVVDKIWAFGPQKAGGCFLIDARKSSTSYS
jgi:ribosome assembly protein 1